MARIGRDRLSYSVWEGTQCNQPSGCDWLQPPGSSCGLGLVGGLLRNPPSWDVRMNGFTTDHKNRTCRYIEGIKRVKLATQMFLYFHFRKLGFHDPIWRLNIFSTGLGTNHQLKKMVTKRIIISILRHFLVESVASWDCWMNKLRWSQREWASWRVASAIIFRSVSVVSHGCTDPATEGTSNFLDMGDTDLDNWKNEKELEAAWWLVIFHPWQLIVQWKRDGFSELKCEASPLLLA